MTDPTEHVMLALGGFFSGSGVLAIVGHAVNTYPTPKDPYRAWFLGVVQFAVGQRVAAKNTLNGQQSVVTALPKTD